MSTIITLAVTFVFAAASAATAEQSNAGSSAPVEEGVAAGSANTLPIVTAGGRDGFSIASADGAFRLRARGYAQGDARFIGGPDSAASQDSFLMRRVRPILEGTVSEGTDFRFMIAFDQGKTELLDGYLNFKYFPTAQLRVGKFKAPFGIELLQSPTNMAFAERGLPNNLVPNRDVGAMLHGDLLAGRLNYAAAIVNGVADRGKGDSDVDESKEFAGRVFATPWKSQGPSWLTGLGVGFAVTAGDATGNSDASYLPSFKTAGQTTFFSYRSDVIADGQHTRYSPQMYYSCGPLGLLGEYVRSTQEVRLDASTLEVANDAWQVAASWVLTGESASYKGVTPKQEFDPHQGTWGAFEVVGRVGALDVDAAAFPIFADASKSARSARAWGIGLNWYWNRNVRWTFSYDHTTFDGGGAGGLDREAENAFVARAQLSF